MNKLFNLFGDKKGVFTVIATNVRSGTQYDKGRLVGFLDAFGMDYQPRRDNENIIDIYEGPLLRLSYDTKLKEVI